MESSSGCEGDGFWMTFRPSSGSERVKLSERKKNCVRKAKASSSSFSDFLPSMPVPLCQLPSPAGSDVVTTTPSSSVCVVTYSATTSVISAALFIAPADATPVEPGHKQRHIESLEHAKMLAAFEDFWAARRHSSPCPGPATALPLVTPPVPLLAVPFHHLRFQ